MNECLSGLVGTIIGGVISIICTYITLHRQYKKDKELQESRFIEEDKKWLRENRLESFTELVDVLESY